MSQFELPADLIGPAGPLDASRPNDLSQAVTANMQAMPAQPSPQQSIEQRVAAQESVIFRTNRAEQLRQSWSEQEETQWDGFDPNEDAVGDGYARRIADEVDRMAEEAGKDAPSVDAEIGLQRDVAPLAEASKRAALLRERQARLDNARGGLSRRFTQLQTQAEQEPEQLGALMTQSDRLISEHQPLLAGQDTAKVRMSSHEALARRAIAGALAIDPQSAAGKLPGRAVLAREEMAAWDSVAHAMAEVQEETNRKDWGRRFRRDLKSIGETGEPGFELVEWIAEASGGAEGRIGPRLKAAEALADRLVLARDAAREAHRQFQAAKFGDYGADLKALDKADENDAEENDDDGKLGIDAAGFWRQAQNTRTHLKRLRRQHAQRLRADPGAVAFEHPLVRRAWDKGDAEGAIAQGLALQERMGVVRPALLPRQQADALVQRIASTPAAEIPALMENLKNAGEDNLAPLLAQMVGAGLSPSLALAGVLSGAAQAALLEAREAAAKEPGAKPDADNVEQAKAGFGETRLGGLLHRGAAKFGRDEPAWERAYRAAEAAVVQVGTALARGEGDAGASRAALLLFGSLDDDRRALDRAATALGAPREGRAGLYRVAGGGKGTLTPSDVPEDGSQQADEAMPAAPTAIQGSEQAQAPEEGSQDVAGAPLPAGNGAPVPSAESPGDEGVVVDDGTQASTDEEDDDDEDDSAIIGKDGTVDPKAAWEELDDEELARLGFDADAIDLIRKAKSATPETLPQILREIQDWVVRSRAGVPAQELSQYQHSTNQLVVKLRQLAQTAAKGEPIDQVLGEARMHSHPVSRQNRVDTSDELIGAALPFLRLRRRGSQKDIKGQRRPSRIYDDPNSPDSPTFDDWSRKLKFADNYKKHHFQSEGRVSKSATNPEKALRNSYRLSPNSRERIAVDEQADEIVIIRIDHNGNYHAFAPTREAVLAKGKWRERLRKLGLIDDKGRIIPRAGDRNVQE